MIVIIVVNVDWKYVRQKNLKGEVLINLKTKTMFELIWIGIAFFIWVILIILYFLFNLHCASKSNWTDTKYWLINGGIGILLFVSYIYVCFGIILKT